ncbi:dTDP-4-dehydrorhamnose reductase [Megamonas sp.]|uniref:dTDP-4-dehydrorhamnose reductase n=1 Tax=Megamonas sp. TaxID=2049033 RepID=UPI002582DBCC|nr:dTDP-4-dehydrorhamnose reductase [Megamonas sp.]
MKVLVTGYTGQLGFDVIRELKARNIECIGTTRNEFSLTDIEKMQAFVKAYKPDVVIHCAAYTAVDKAEDEVELCDQINHLATKKLAKVCKEIDAKMIYISTDYVFAGSGEDFYEVSDEKAPQNVYGKSKLDGELAVQEILDKYFIVRISWVFGSNGKNFIKTMLNLAKTHDKLTVVNDQIGSPTYTVDLAKLLCDMALSDKYGVYHATNEGICSWYDFACEIFKQADIKINVKPVSSTAFPTKAIRPHNSRMSKKCLDEAGFNRLPTWQNALTKYLKEINK